MEIKDDHIIALIQGQASLNTSMADLKDTVNKGFTFLHEEHKDLEKRVHKTEQVAWYGSGIAGVLAVLANVVHFTWNK
jgi:hypothetical protein